MLQSTFETLAGIAADAPVSLDPRSVLQAVRSNAGRLKGWRHPLGFVHIELTPLIDAPARHRFRLHVWDNEAGTIDDLGDLHDHIWDLRSWVMSGELVDITYMPRRSEAGIYMGSRIHYGEVNSSEAVDRYELVPLRTRAIRQGNVYTIPQGTVHSSRPAVVPTVTLLVSVEDPEAAKRGPLVLTRNRPLAGVTAERVGLRSKDLLAVLDNVATILDVPSA